MEITVCYMLRIWFIQRARNACKRSNKIWKKRGTMSLQIISSVALLHIFHSQFVRHFPDFQLQSLCAFETLKVLKIWYSAMGLSVLWIINFLLCHFFLLQYQEKIRYTAISQKSADQFWNENTRNAYIGRKWRIWWGFIASDWAWAHL